MQYKRVKFVFDINSPDKHIIDIVSKVIEPELIIVSFINNITSDFTDIACDICNDIYKNKDNKNKIKEIEESVKSKFLKYKPKVVLKNYNYQDLNKTVKNIIDDDIELLVSTNNFKHKDYTNFLKRVIRRSTSSVLIIPDNFNGFLESINIGVDFSKISKKLIETGTFIYDKLSLNKINLINIYSVPYGYHKLGKSYTQFSKTLETNIMQNFKELVADFNNYNFNFKIINNEDIAKTLIDITPVYSLLIVGDRGKNTSNAVILGSVPEDLVLNTNNPILLVREKMEKLSFLASIMGIDY